MRLPLIHLNEVLEWEKEQSPKITPSLREAFDCGEPTLNVFLSRYARQSEEQNTARTWVALDKPNKKIVGYVSISNTSIEKQDAASAVRSYVNPIPALLIARLAVDQTYKRQGWGEEILLGAFQKAKEINEISAIQAVVVDTLNANAEAFYKVYGFVKIGDTNKMIISTKELFD